MSNTTTESKLAIEVADMRARQMATFIAAGQYEMAAKAGLSIYDTLPYLYLKRNLITQDKGMLDMFLDVAILYVYTVQERPPILIRGESGTGKETVARAFAQGMTITNQQLPFVGINCTSLPDYLVESELFGHVKGAFTGAINDRVGLLKAAGQGVCLIDEIGDMPLSLQPKLLRALQERVIRPVGSNVETEINCRIVCATHRDLRQQVTEKQFREDLYWRIAQFKLEISPLRERYDDIMLYLNAKANDLSAERRKDLYLHLSTKRMLHGNYREVQQAVNQMRLNSWRTQVLCTKL